MKVQKTKSTSKEYVIHLFIYFLTQITFQIEGGYVIEDDDGSTSPSTTILYPFSGNLDNHFMLGKILLKYRPRFVIIYDASLTFIRQLEVKQNILKFLRFMSR